jgi:hypothetical protein
MTLNHRILYLRELLAGTKTFHRYNVRSIELKWKGNACIDDLVTNLLTIVTRSADENRTCAAISFVANYFRADVASSMSKKLCKATEGGAVSDGCSLAIDIEN